MAKITHILESWEEVASRTIGIPLCAHPSDDGRSFSVFIPAPFASRIEHGYNFQPIIDCQNALNAVIDRIREDNSLADKRIIWHVGDGRIIGGDFLDGENDPHS